MKNGSNYHWKHAHTLHILIIFTYSKQDHMLVISGCSVERQKTNKISSNKVLCKILTTIISYINLLSPESLSC